MNYTELKYRARASMRAATPTVYIVSAVCVGLIFVLTLLSNEVSGYNDLFDAVYSGNFGEEYYQNLNHLIRPGASILALCIQAMIAFLNFGYASFTLKVSRGLPSEVKNLFDGFLYPLKVIGLIVVEGVIITFLTLLLIVPGIIASYKYRFSYHVMLDNPDLGIMECLRKSAEITSGHKLDLFILDLTFIGWIFAGIALQYFIYVPALDIWVTPYRMITVAHAYNEYIGYVVPEMPDVEGRE